MAGVFSRGRTGGFFDSELVPGDFDSFDVAFPAIADPSLFSAQPQAVDYPVIDYHGSALQIETTGNDGATQPGQSDAAESADRTADISDLYYYWTVLHPGATDRDGSVPQDAAAGNDGADRSEQGVSAESIDRPAGNPDYYWTELFPGATDRDTPVSHDGTSGDDVLSGIAIDTDSAAIDETINGFAGNDTINALNGNDKVNGGDGDDILNGGPGNDMLYGGSGDDTFVFDPGFGNDVVFDWASGDKFSFSSADFADFAAVQAAMTQVGADTLITLDANETVLIKDTLIADFTAGDFLFV